MAEELNWDALPPGTEQVIGVAKGYANEMGEGCVGTEHLLLAVLDCPVDDVAVRMLIAMGAMPGIRAYLMKQIVRRPGRSGIDPVLTPRAQRVISLAVTEMRLRQGITLELKDLLVGLLVEDDGIAARALQRLVTSSPSELRNRLAQVTLGLLSC